MNGYTPETPIKTRLTNLTATAGCVALLEAAAESNGDPHECERILTAKAYEALRVEAELTEIERRNEDYADYQATIAGVMPALF